MRRRWRQLRQLTVEARKARRKGVPFPRQLYELLYLKLRGGVGPLTYYRLGLFRRSLPWAERRNIVSETWYSRRMAIINPPEFRVVAWNKLITYGILSAFDIRTPVVHGLCSPRHGRSADGHPLRCADDLRALIQRASLRSAIFKPVGAWSGRGFSKVTLDGAPDDPRVTPAPKDESMTVEAFWDEYLGVPREEERNSDKFYGYLCQEALSQHPDVAVLHPESINTARLWLQQARPGRWELFAGVQRMGVGDMTIDNSAAGGIGSPIDIETGRLGVAIRRGLDLARGVDFQEYPVHPTNGVRIEGHQLPMWDTVLPLARRVCSIFPYFRLMGLDIAFGPEGVVVVEIEADPHANHQTYFGKGIRGIVSKLYKDVRAEPRGRFARA